MGVLSLKGNQVFLLSLHSHRGKRLSVNGAAVKMQCETLQDPETNGYIRMGRGPALLCAWLTMQAMLGFSVDPSPPLASASVCQSFPLLTSSRSSPASPLNSLLTFWQLRFKNRSFDFDIFKFLLSFSVGFLGIY